MGSAVIQRHFEQGYKNVLVAPMISNGVLLGSFNAVSYKEDAFGPDDVQCIVVVGQWIGSQFLIHRFAREMKRLAMVDQMTNKANRRAFMTAAEDRMGGFLGADRAFR